MDDQQIVELFFARSEDAVEALAKKYGRLCESVAQNVLHDRQDAEECVNDAYLGVWNAIPPARPDPLRAYVCRVVRNLAVKRYHANRAAKRNSQYDLALEELTECLADVRSLETEADAAELSRALDEFLAALDPEARILFVRRYWFSDSIGELAEAFRISRHNATVRLSRIRGRLKNFLEERGFSV